MVQEYLNPRTHRSSLVDDQSVTVLSIFDSEGTIRLSERPPLRSGAVEVTIRPLVKLIEGKSAWDYLKRTRAELEASGHRFRTKEEIDADLEEDRDWGEERFDEIYRQIDDERRRNNQADRPSQASDLQP